MTHPLNNPPDSKQQQGVQSFYEPALKLLNDLLERNRANLRKRGYNEMNAAITRHEFKEQMQRQFCITMHLASEIDISLYNAGKVECFGGYVKPKVGVKS